MFALKERIKAHIYYWLIDHIHMWYVPELLGPRQMLLLDHSFSAR